MSSILRKHSRQKIVTTSVLMLSLALTACGSQSSDDSSSADSSANSTADSSASASTSGATESASASSSASASANKSKESTKAEGSTASASSESTDAASDEEQPAEIYAGSEALASASSVDTSQEQVSKTQDLYSQYEGALASVETKTVEPTDGTSDGSSEQQEGQPSGNNVELGDSTLADIEKVATGSAADEFSSSALEYGINGWTQKGSSKIVGEPKIADTTYDGKDAKILEVCLDSSDVVVKDEAGNVMNSSSAPKKSLNIFTLVQEDGSWKIAAHDFPNNPDC